MSSQRKPILILLAGILAGGILTADLGGQATNPASNSPASHAVSRYQPDRFAGRAAGITL